MKLLAIFWFTLLPLTGYSQQAVYMGIPSGSYEKLISKSYPAIKYTYDSVSQTHDYSNNWDFDKDGINDKVYFIGTGGAHLYYFLNVVLSSDHQQRSFEFIQSDFPLFTGSDITNSAQSPVGFKVADLGKRLTPTLIIRLDEQTLNQNSALKKRKIKTKNVMVRFEDGKAKFNSL